MAEKKKGASKRNKKSSKPAVETDPTKAMCCFAEYRVGMSPELFDSDDKHAELNAEMMRVIANFAAQNNGAVTLEVTTRIGPPEQVRLF